MTETQQSEAGLNLDEFRWRLAEVIAWCDKRADADRPATCLRSKELQPPMYRGYLSPPHERLQLADFSFAGAAESVECLARQRADLLRATGQYPAAPVSSPAPGALLVYYRDLNLFDGAAELVSGGFFDTDNIPPWACWLALLPGETVSVNRPNGTRFRAEHVDFLVSWVPPTLIQHAQEGVLINPEACIEWASDLHSPFIELLRDAELITEPGDS